MFGIIDDLNLHGHQYSWSSAIVYVAQLVFQPAIAYFLVKLPIGKFCGVMVCCWGITLCGMTAANNFGGLMAARFVLGAFEASVAPTFIGKCHHFRKVASSVSDIWYSPGTDVVPAV